MYSRDASLKKFFVGSLIVFGILVYCTGAGITRDIEVEIEKSRVILEEAQHIEYQNIEKMESVFKIPIIAGARG